MKSLNGDVSPKTNDFERRDFIEEIIFRRKATQEKMRVRLIDGRRTLKGLLLGGVGTCKRTVGGSCLFRAEGDIRQNRPSVQS